MVKNKYFWAGSIVGIVLVLDQVTKFIVEKRIRLYETIVVIPGFFNLTHVRNKGAAFGILSSFPAFWRSMFFITVTVVAIVAIAFLIRKAHERLLVIAFSLIIGGAIGNVIDRIRFGEVIDFIQWYIKSYYWPSFNVADSAITVGVALLAFEMLFLDKTRPGESKSEYRNPK